MAPDPRVVKAFNAMKEIGISAEKVKPVLKKLLKLCDKNWDVIEEENYRLLADAIFDAEDTETPEKKVTANGEEDLENDVADEPERPLKLLRLRNREEHASQNDSNPQVAGRVLIVPKEEREEMSAAKASQESTRSRRSQLRSSPPQNLKTSDEVSPRIMRSSKGKEPLLPKVSPKEKRASYALQIRDSTSETEIVFRRKASTTHLLLKVKDEPIDDVPLNDAPSTAIQPESLETPNCQEPVSSHFEVQKEKRDKEPAPSKETGSNDKLAIIPGGPTAANLEIASSLSGEVKISLSFNALFGRSTFRVPSQDQLLKAMQEKCARTYKALDPNFSIKQVLEDMCECFFVELATDSSNRGQST